MRNHRRLAGRLDVSGLALVPLLLVSASLSAQTPGDSPGQTPPSPAPSQVPWYQQISVNGLISGSYVVNLNSPPSRTNQFRVFDVYERTFEVDVVELVVQHAIATRGQAGFRVDFTAGTTIPRVTAAAGLFRNEAGEAGDFDVQQAFVSYIAPVGKGLRVDAGKFVTHIGYEVIEGYDGYNDNHSRSLLFGYAEPITHTGLRMSYPISDTVSAQVHLVNGWDNVVDNNTGKSIGAQLAFAPSARLTGSVNYICGPEQQDNNSNIRQVLDVYAVAKATQALTLVASYDRGREDQALLAESAGGGARDSTWQGVAVYARYAFANRAAATLRAEWFDDPQGARTGYVQTLKEITLTPEFRPHPSLIIRGDLRRDWSDRRVFETHDGALSDSQVTVSVNAVFVF